LKTSFQSRYHSASETEGHRPSDTYSAVFSQVSRLAINDAGELDYGLHCSVGYVGNETESHHNVKPTAMKNVVPSSHLKLGISTIPRSATAFDMAPDSHLYQAKQVAVNRYKQFASEIHKVVDCHSAALDVYPATMQQDSTAMPAFPVRC
jgi:hypothetical protein